MILLLTSSANTAARRGRNWKLKPNETPPTHINRSRGVGGVWGIEPSDLFAAKIAGSLNEMN